MEIQHHASATELASALAAWWSAPRSDPFTFDLAVVPSAGFQRWLSQQLATADGNDGICAGVEFSSPGRLWHRVAPDDDPWRPARLSWLIQQVALAETCPPGLERLRAHLDASRETYSVAARIARQFSGYATHAPAMLAAWAAGSDVDLLGRPLDDSAWQAVLWRELATTTGTDPLQQRRDVLDVLRAEAVPGLPQRIAVVAPPRLDAAMMEFYEALGTHHQVRLLLLTAAPTRVIAPTPEGRRSQLRRTHGHPLNQTLGGLADENASFAPPSPLPAPDYPDTLLGWLAADLFADRPPQQRTMRADDRSIQVHLSHGPARQVEVLRDVLADLYAADPTLEPRHVAVLTPDVDAYAPLLDAAFTPQPGVLGHPAQQFRLRLADRTVAQANRLVGLLLELLRLPDSRLEAATVLELCALAPVADRFGFTADARERLAELVAASGVRWGLNAAHRADYDLNLPQNTWQAGLQRMLLGVTMSEQDMIAVGTVLPLDDTESSDVERIGALTELIGRLSRWMADIASPATMSQWVQRCRDGLAALTRLNPTDEWQAAELNAGLNRLADAAGPGLVGRHAALTAIEAAFTGTPARGAFGNGATIVAGLNSLRSVPHRVVVLLGWDADRYPRPPHRHGDDLLGIDPPIGSGSAALSDRQALLDAIHAAQQTLVIVGRGRSEATNESVPPATPIAEFLDALDATACDAAGNRASRVVVYQHPLQPFAPEYFTAEARLPSVDPVAYRAAQAWTVTFGEPAPARDRFRLEPLPPLDLSQGVTLDELTDFFKHPARALLKTRAGISTGEDPELGDEIPIELDHLTRWQIGNRVLRRLSDGADPDLVERAEWLRGQVPPFELGRQVMGGILSEARRTVAKAPGLGEATQHDVHLSLAVPGVGEVPLTGRITTHDRTVWQVEFSSLQPRQKIQTWLRLLTLAAGEPGSWDARVIGKGRQVRYAAPPSSIAADLLGRYVAIYSLGMQHPLPALPRLNAEWAGLRLTGGDPDDPRREKAMRRLWDFESDAAWSKFFGFPDVLTMPCGDFRIPGAAPAETRLLGALATAIWTPLLGAEVAP
ncbi:MAG: exodeoxyribonuclease V subunit gamma [Actinobacteria bacterium HGW-Actinobacteria-2]|nr:MAG: exodeoxyribonuclease V subunit gamma [Actinobacteria bacterium HGW-Actinobacteria-2]